MTASSADSRQDTASGRTGEREAPLGAGPEARQQRGSRTRSLLSPDESWWWNGRRWVPARTEDGLWAWNGSRWRTAAELEGKPAEVLAGALIALADERRTEAGAILAARAAEWQPEGEIRHLVRRAEEIATRLQQTQEGLTSAPNRRMLGRRSAVAADSHALEAERETLTAQQRTLHAQIGRLAPHPTVKEADDGLAAARILEERSTLLTSALEQVQKAEGVQAEAQATARRELAAMEEARLEAIRRAEKGLEDARSGRDAALAEARDRFRSTLSTGMGDLEVGLGQLYLHSRVLRTPSGSLPTAGLIAAEGTAATLWRSHRELLSGLVVLELPETASFLTALVTGSDTLFVLFKNSTGAALWMCPTGQEVAARRFLVALREQARQADAGSDQSEARAREAEQTLEALGRDRSSVEAAEKELARVKADQELQAAIERARRNLEQAGNPISQLVAARKKVEEEVSRLLTPPEPLTPRQS
ncbi:MAG: hypothetical protein M3075_18990 [Candidatus Dormibacteraeota bacterium]|nr:hypothetical protein [Candidatus Dormibacteraeota bacterium]